MSKKSKFKDILDPAPEKPAEPVADWLAIPKPEPVKRNILGQEVKRHVHSWEK